MTFVCEGKRYDTLAMDGYETKAAHEPVVYITRDLKSVFVQTMSRSNGVGVHQADDTEIRRLWKAYGTATLLRVLAVMGDHPATGKDRERQHQLTTQRRMSARDDAEARL